MGFLSILVSYLRQPSTWRGAIAVASAAGVAVSPDLTEAITTVGVAGIGLVEVIRNEVGK